MESIRIHINRLGLIRNADIQLTPLMVFSGESGLGKSYLAILCHYFFTIWLSETGLEPFFEGRGLNFHNAGSLPETPHNLVIKKNDLEQWLAKDAIRYMRYMLGHDNLAADITVQLPSVIPDDIVFAFAQELVGLNNNTEIYYKLSALHLIYRFRQLGIGDESPYSYLLRSGVIQELFGDFKNLADSFILPPSRGAVLSEKIIPKTGLYQSFIEDCDDLEKSQEMPDSVSPAILNNLKAVLNGSVRKESDSYIYETSDGESMPISAAASSVRELAPLQLLITKNDISKMAILIEEPESHLHPLKQRMTAEIIALMAMTKANMQVTTHSDYFLGRLNDLIRLHILKSKMEPAEYDAFCSNNDINGSLTLDPALLSAYFLSRSDDGSVSVTRQDSSRGIPFDTFETVNGKFMADSSTLFEMTADLD